MSASYPGYYNTPSPSVPWRGVTTTGRVVSRPSSVGRDGVIPGGMPGRVSNVPTPIYADTSMASHFVPSSPSPDAQVFRHLNAGIANLTLGNSKLSGEDHVHHEKHYEKTLEENYNTSSAMAIPGANDSSGWKKGSSSNPNNNNNSEPGSPSSPSKRSSLDIEKEINAQNLYKTELCRSFVETGMCRYGSKCQFAHGQSELRPVLRHPKYKTDFCKTFHTIGTCPYGTRCRFIHKRADADHNIYPPTSSVPEWSIWKDGNTPEGKAQYGNQTEEKKPRSISLKERRKTTDVQQLQKLDKNKAQRAIGRQRSNTDSPPPPVRRKNPNGFKKGPVPLATTTGPLKHEHASEKSQRRKSTGNSWSDELPVAGVENSSRLHDSLVEHDLNVAQSVHSPSSQIPHHLLGHLNGGVNPATNGHLVSRHVVPEAASGRAVPLVSAKVQFPQEEAYLPPEVLSDDEQLSPSESVEAPLNKGEKHRRRSNSSASRLPIFQELCTASEEEIAIGATASTVVNRVLSSSS